MTDRTAKIIGYEPLGWNPYQKWNHTGSLIERMLELGFFYSSYQAEMDGFHNWGFFKKGKFGLTPRHANPDLQTAICEAALVAFEDSK